MDNEQNVKTIKTITKHGLNVGTSTAVKIASSVVIPKANRERNNFDYCLPKIPGITKEQVIYLNKNL